MKNLVLAIIFPGLLTAACAQQNALPMKYAQIINPELAKQHLSILASDAFEGRETGMPGADKAAHYIADEFKSLGLQPIVNGSYFFDVPLVQNTTKITLSASSQNFEYGTDVYDYHPAATGTINASEVLFVGFGTDTEIAGIDLTGKVLLWIDEDKQKEGIKANTGARPSSVRTEILKSLMAKNPALILGINPEIAGLLKRIGPRFIRPRLTVKADGEMVAKPGVLFITSAAADAILKPSGKLSDTLISVAARSNFTAQTLKADFKLSVQTDTTAVKAVDVLGYLPWQ